MKITLLLVGKTDISWVKSGLDLYCSRLQHYVPFELRYVPELKNTASLSEDQIKQREGEMILKALKSSEDLVLLDERGKEFRSVEFATFISDRLSKSSRDIVFCIGGAYGFSRSVYDRSSSMISLSRMTFSHQMVRVIFAEQLYRAFAIIKGEPYHHE